MCGISGLYNLKGKPVEATHVELMCDLIKHRGPDDSGIYTDGSIALGHRRLSIIDLSHRGRNPMHNEDETIWIICNGEIYNYEELRNNLLAHGHLFRSDTDTEVIIHLYEEYGLECIEMLNGMFAFAIYDQESKPNAKGSKLILARDRFGVKPLYYVILGDTLSFASEIKAFLALPDFKARPDFFALSEHYTFQNTFEDRTFFEGVKLLPAGNCMVCENGRIRRRQYWDLHFQSDPNLSNEEWARGLRERFEVAVRRQLMSDVPLGTYLSGGMDTGAISAVATRHIKNMHTFTCGFDLPRGASDLEKYFDEREESKHLATYLKTTHHELTLGPESMEPVLPTLVWYLDEPRVGISYQVYYTAQLISRYVTVVLSGVGGDELFAGYPWRYGPILDLDNSQFEKTYYKLWNRFFTDEEKRRFFTPEVNKILGDFSAFDSFRSVLNSANGMDPLHKALYFDFKTFLNGLLIVDDKLSMAHSVEARVPFLDNDLVDYVSRIPAELKMKGSESKAVLKKAMRGLLPDETIFRKKQGFTPPDRTWYKKYHMPYIKDLINGPRALSRGFFEPHMLSRILEDHSNDKKDNRFLIWSLMCFEWWNRLFVDKEEIPDPTQIKWPSQNGGA